MFRVTRYPMISKTESGRVGNQKEYLVAGWIRVPAGHWVYNVKTEWKVALEVPHSSVGLFLRNYLHVPICFH